MSLLNNLLIPPIMSGPKVARVNQKIVQDQTACHVLRVLETVSGAIQLGAESSEAIEAPFQDAVGVLDDDPGSRQSLVKLCVVRSLGGTTLQILKKYDGIKSLTNIRNNHISPDSKSGVA